MRLQPAAVLSLLALALLIMLLRPRYYQRHRSWLLPELRVAPMLPPSTRRLGVGTALMLERAARPGLRGTVVGVLRAATGALLSHGLAGRQGLARARMSGAGALPGMAWRLQISPLVGCKCSARRHHVQGIPVFRDVCTHPQSRCIAESPAQGPSSTLPPQAYASFLTRCTPCFRRRCPRWRRW